MKIFSIPNGWFFAARGSGLGLTIVKDLVNVHYRTIKSVKRFK